MQATELVACPSIELTGGNDQEREQENEFLLVQFQCGQVGLDFLHVRTYVVNERKQALALLVDMRVGSVEVVPSQRRVRTLQAQNDDAVNRGFDQLHLIVNVMESHEARNTSGEFHCSIGVDFELIHAR